MTTRGACPACNKNQFLNCYLKNGYSIYRCISCGTLFVFSPPSSEDLTNIYNGKYYDLPIESINRIRYENRRRLRVIRQYKSIGDVLDIGCARGDFLNEAKQLGFTTFGIELSLENANISRENGHTVFHGDLDAYCLQNDKLKQFDLISCLDVIEHVADPTGFLRKSLMLLKDDGIMILTTPNYSGVLAKILKDRDPYMTPPEHLNFFTKKGMRFLIERNGFSQKRYLTFGRLTAEELKRVAPKYFPAFMQLFLPLFQYVIPIGLALLNLFKVGMEHEFYIRPKRERG